MHAWLSEWRTKLDPFLSARNFLLVVLSFWLWFVQTLIAIHTHTHTHSSSKRTPCTIQQSHLRCDGRHTSLPDHPTCWRREDSNANQPQALSNCPVNSRVHLEGERTTGTVYWQYAPCCQTYIYGGFHLVVLRRGMCIYKGVVFCIIAE